MFDVNQWLNMLQVLLIPIFAYVIRIDHRVTRLETIEEMRKQSKTA